MKYFKYVKTLSPEISRRIWEELISLIPYAKTVHRGDYNNAINDCYAAVSKNFKPEKCTDLHNYIIKTLKHIYKPDKELAEDEEKLNHVYDKEAMRRDKIDNSYDKVLDVLSDEPEDLKECICYILPKYIHDFKFFDSENLRGRQLDYSDVWELYSKETILAALRSIEENYKPEISEFFENKARYKRVFRSYAEDRYKKSFDESVSFICNLEGVVLYNYRPHARKNRTIYKMNIRQAVRRLKYIIKDDLYIYFEKYGMGLWSSLSGEVCTEEKINDYLENEIVGKILADFSLVKVLAYNRGNTLFITGTQTMPEYLHIKVFDKTLSIEIENVVSKEVK